VPRSPLKIAVCLVRRTETEAERNPAVKSSSNCISGLGILWEHSPTIPVRYRTRTSVASGKRRSAYVVGGPEVNRIAVPAEIAVGSRGVRVQRLARMFGVFERVHHRRMRSGFERGAVFAIFSESAECDFSMRAKRAEMIEHDAVHERRWFFFPRHGGEFISSAIVSVNGRRGFFPHNTCLPLFGRADHPLACEAPRSAVRCRRRGVTSSRSMKSDW